MYIHVSTIHVYTWIVHIITCMYNSKVIRILEEHSSANPQHRSCNKTHYMKWSNGQHITMLNNADYFTLYIWKIILKSIVTLLIVIIIIRKIFIEKKTSWKRNISLGFEQYKGPLAYKAKATCTTNKNNKKVLYCQVWSRHVFWITWFEAELCVCNTTHHISPNDCRDLDSTIFRGG